MIAVSQVRLSADQPRFVGQCVDLWGQEIPALVGDLPVPAVPAYLEASSTGQRGTWPRRP